MRIPLALSTLVLLVTVSTTAQGPAPTRQDTTGPAGDGTNLLIGAVAWKQTAAEYRALYYQGYALARAQVERALGRREPGGRPLAVVSDLDDTVLLPLGYWAALIEQDRDFFDDGLWDAWIPMNRMTVAPGATEFFRFCEANGVEVFYVTQRDQGERTYEYALGHLRQAGLPYADDAHLTVLRETSNKESRQNDIAQKYEIAVFLGDNLNDFRRKYYADGVDERLRLMEEDRALYGTRYILFPNPTDGHWLRAIFGDSEPRPTDANREAFKRAATTVRPDRR